METFDFLLPWIYSFGITNEECPNLESLREGHVLSKIFNSIQDNVKIDLSALKTIDHTKDDWISCLRNLKTVQENIKDQFSKLQIRASFDLTSIARRSNPDSLKQLLVSFLLYSLKGPKKTENISRVKSLPKNTVKEIQTLIKENSSSSHSSGSPKSDNNSSNVITQYQQILDKLDSECKQLASENEKLQNEIESLRNQQSNSNNKYMEMYLETKAKRDSEIQLGEKLDKELQNKEALEEKRKQLLQEISNFQKKQKVLKEKASEFTTENFENSNDPAIQQLVNEIKETEKLISQDNITKLENERARLKKFLLSMAADVKEKKKIVGDNPIDMNSNNEVVTKLQKEIEELIDKNNQINEEIMGIIQKADSIEQLKSPKSLLEQMRTGNFASTK
ncbi:hypothetical protein GPJ56_001339 [Histomonas meleagridis]|uniref:uncharacterized protein n=1 Tax=Histomonas meleagridis TaxID=135588 RepID=UPI00355A0609|nr:hypothetical protein GPJ56_001339 [Histomonas meleagridis]KAH0805095.1 hypothetical protein GO595_002040 [Histomonas meleagridis]